MTPATILVVEDNAITRKMVRVALAAEGYTVLEAPDGRTALELMATTPPDLVLQDLRLPDVDGFELVGRLRAVPGGTEVPVIAFSGFLSRLEATEASAAGFTDFLLKPVEPSRLVQVVATYLSPREVPSEQPGRGRHVLVVDDDPIQLRLAREHLTRLGFEVTTASDGAQALARARQARPDAILSDVLMPGLDGFQLCMAVRQDPRLARIPVVLTSANYGEEADRRLAERVGASALTVRTPDFDAPIRALLKALGREPPPASGASVDRLEAERLHRVVRQLERQVALNTSLLQQCSLQASVLSILAGVSRVLARPLDVDLASAELLANLLDAGGISTGMLHLVGPDGRLRLQAQSGAVDAAAEGDAFFGHPELFEGTLRAGLATVIPSPAVPEASAREFLGRAKVVSAIIAPLVSGGEALGVLLMGSTRRDLADRDWLAFAQTMALQIAQTIALGRAVSRLVASEQRYRSLFDRVPVGLFRTTPDAQILDANPALTEVLGFPDRDALIAANATDLYVDPEERRRLMAGAGEGDVREFETRLRRRDGAVIGARIKVRVTREADGRLSYEGSLEDITARRQAEEDLRRHREALVQAEKLAAMGSLLAGVAHELNNPLSVVLGQAALLRLALADPRLQARAEKLARASERCARIVKNFLALARQRPLERGSVALNQVVEEAVELLAYPLRVDDVQVTLDLTPDVPPIWADPHQLHQVVVNLVTNAHQAMRGSAPPCRLTITTRFDPTGARVSLEIADTGPGIPPEIRARVFEPFFTTKPPGQGTGLGLSLCRGIVEGHDGTIRVEERAGPGAVFRIELPVQAPLRAEAEPRVPEAPAAIRGRRILVVDDEPDVAAVLADLLATDGHTVDTASDGVAALEKLGERVYDLILSDLKMPQLDGPGLFREVERRHPALRRRFVFLTGDTLSPDAAEFLERTGAPNLSKPFALEEVQRLVRQVLRTA